MRAWCDLGAAISALRSRRCDLGAAIIFRSRKIIGAEPLATVQY
jgi:hypothetical protein